MELYGLVLPEHGFPLRVGENLKVVWRMTGTGDLIATATAPDGAPAALVWGPERHDGSSYDRPGEEWGVGYLLTERGCWHLHLSRGDAQGDVWLEVVAP